MSQPMYLFANSEKEFAEAANLFAQYAHWLGVDLCFQSFEEELAGLQKMYNLTDGGIVLCKVGDEYVGCSAVRRINENVAELKRMFVQNQYRRLGIGEVLLKKSLELAREKGYLKIKLDTLQRLDAAIALYKKYGFAEIEKYYDNPLENVVYMELDLSKSL